MNIKGKFSDIVVKSGVGEVNLRQISCFGDRVEVSVGTRNGIVELGTLPKQKVGITVGVGDVKVRIPIHAKASAKMISGVGKVRSDFPLASRRHLIGGMLSGDLNSGGTHIDVSVGTGNVSLERMSASILLAFWELKACAIR